MTKAQIRVLQHLQERRGVTDPTDPEWQSLHRRGVAAAGLALARRGLVEYRSDPRNFMPGMTLLDLVKNPFPYQYRLTEAGRAHLASLPLP